MNFDDLVTNVENPSRKEVVGLAIYFLDRVRGIDPVEYSAVRELLSKSRADVPTNHVSTYVSRLQDSGYLTRTKDGFRLTGDGLDLFSEIVDLQEYEGKLRDQLFIENRNGVSHFYEALITDINRAYQYGIDDAVLILSRKLLENLVLDLLRTRYGLNDEKKELFYDMEKGRLLGFSRLLENLKDNFHDDFNYWSDRFDMETIQEIETLKGRGDATAHSVEIDVAEEEIEDHREQVSPVINTLFYVLDQIEKSS